MIGEKASTDAEQDRHKKEEVLGEFAGNSGPSFSNRVR